MHTVYRMSVTVYSMHEGCIQVVTYIAALKARDPGMFAWEVRDRLVHDGEFHASLVLWQLLIQRL